MTTGAGRVWNGQSPEDRRADRRARFIAAGIDIMGSDGAGAVTIRAICRRTKISERHFYELFSTKDEFITSVYDQVLGDGARLLSDLNMEEASEAPPEELLRTLLRAWIDFIGADPRRGRIIAVEGANNSVLARRGRRVAVDLMATYAAYTTGEQADHADAAAREVTATVLFTGMWALLLAWQADGLENPMTKEQLIGHLVSLIQRAQPFGA